MTAVPLNSPEGPGAMPHVVASHGVGSPAGGPPGGSAGGPGTGTGRDAHRLNGDDVASLLVGMSREFSRSDVSRLAGVSVVGARRFWHALGFPSTTSSDRLFTEADLRALRRMTVLVRSGVIDEPTALALTRAFARNADRLAAWQVQLLAESLTPSPAEVSGPLDEDTAQATARLVLDLADELEPMLVYAWRRHLTDALSRMLSDVEAATADAPSQLRCVGFADLVAFTSFVRQLSERDLARTVQRFEAVATDVVTAHGGRVVKTVGDEVLFSTRTPAPGAAIALDLVDALDEDSLLPQVRVGVAFGPVVSRLGDVFGTTVNRAARLTALAHPDAVLVDGPLATALTTQSGFRLTAMRRRTLRGVGSVTPHVLSRTSTQTRRGRIP